MIDRNAPKAAILIVETSMLFRALLNKLLSKLIHYDIILVNDEIEATLQLSRKNIKLIIIGHSVSFGTSLKLVNHVRQTETFQQIPVLKISTAITVNNCYNLYNAGINDLISLNEMDYTVFIKRIQALLKDESIEELALTKPFKVITERPTSVKSVVRKEKDGYEFLKNAKELISPNLVEKRLSRIGDVKTIPFIVAQLIALTSSLDTEIKELEELIKTDHALTAKVLKLANSSYYNRMGTRIYNLKDAIKVIGFIGVKEIAIGVGTIDSFKEKPEETTFNRIGLWYHSFTTGIIARTLARQIKHPQPETCFVSGLLNNIGIAILDDYFNEEFNKVIELSLYYDLPLTQVEEHLLGMKHNEISSRILRLWNFPKNIVIPVSLSDLSFEDILGLDNLFEPFKQDILITKVAGILAKMLSGGLFKNELIAELPEAVLNSKYLKMDKEALFDSITEIKETVKEIMKSTFIHVKTEEILSGDLYERHKIENPIKALLVQSAEDKITPVEVLLLNYDTTIYKTDSDYHNIITKEKPDVIVFDIETPAQAPNIEYIKQIVLREASFVAVLADSTLSAQYQQYIGVHHNVVYMMKPFMVADISNFVEGLSILMKQYHVS
jgi:HD-like signal output (HDOD) protein/DNA-binding NarL/FixJ family response regulator